MSTEHQPTPIAEILDAERSGRPAEPARPEPQQQVEQAPTTGDGPSPDLADDGPPDRQIPFGAFKSERARRKALSARVQELEAENRALLTIADGPPPAEAEAEQLTPEAAIGRINWKANFRASKAEAIATHGKAVYDQLDEAIGRAVQQNHPELRAMAQAFVQSDDPIGVALDWAQRAGLLQSPQQAPQPRQVFPSNFAGARNVGSRSGPAWGGPLSVQSIFAMKREQQKR